MSKTHLLLLAILVILSVTLVSVLVVRANEADRQFSESTSDISAVSLN